MNILSRTAFAKAENYLKTHARELEKALVNYYFHDALFETVIHALSAYQNTDGGFGHALEPDLRTPASSALCTTVAFQILTQHSKFTDSTMIRNGIAYFLSTYDATHRTWRIIPEEAEHSPRAPWWYQSAREERFVGFSLNPTAEILGYLYRYRSTVPNGMLNDIAQRILSELSAIQSIEMHDLLCCLRLLRMQSLPSELRESLHRTLQPLVTATVVGDPSQWEGYCLRPLQVVETPDDTFTENLREAINTNLDYEITEQNHDGSWSVNWSWDTQYPNEWEHAKKEWTGILTCKKLRTLALFGRIE